MYWKRAQQAPKTDREKGACNVTLRDKPRSVTIHALCRREAARRFLHRLMTSVSTRGNSFAGTLIIVGTTMLIAFDFRRYFSSTLAPKVLRDFQYFETIHPEIDDWRVAFAFKWGVLWPGEYTAPGDPKDSASYVFRKKQYLDATGSQPVVSCGERGMISSYCDFPVFRGPCSRRWVISLAKRWACSSTTSGNSD